MKALPSDVNLWYRRRPVVGTLTNHCLISFGPWGDSKVTRKKPVFLFFGSHPKSYCVGDGDDTDGDGDGDLVGDCDDVEVDGDLVDDGDDDYGDGDYDGDGDDDGEDDDDGGGDEDDGDDDVDGGEDDDDGEEVVGTELALAPSLEPHSQWWAPTSLGLSSW